MSTTVRSPVIRRAVALLICVPLLALEACASARSPGGERAEPIATRRTTEPTLVPRDCGVGDLPVQVDCSWLTVPVNRHARHGSTLRLAVAVVRSPVPNHAPDPVVFVEGGPGFDNLSVNLPRFALPGDVFLQSRDVVLFDQRGTGMSEPRLDCPEVDQARVRELGEAQPFAAKLDARRQAVRQCRRRLEAQGVDLNRFNSEASAADLADLRVALGVRSWNLLARSYGSRLALATMRAHPQGIRSVVLDSAYPPTLGRLDRLPEAVRSAFATLSKACTEEGACRAGAPDLRATVQSIVHRLDAAPFEGTADLGPAVGTVPLVVTGAGAYADLVAALANTGAIPALPSTITALANGDTTALKQGANAVSLANGTADGAFLSIECADSAQRELTQRAKRLLAAPGQLGDLVLVLAEPYCHDWRVAPLPASFNDAVKSDIPTLVLAGAFDPLTPPGYGRAVANTLTNATFVDFPASSHGVLNLTGTAQPSDACVVAIVARFVVDPNGAVDTQCAKSATPRFAAGR